MAGALRHFGNSALKERRSISIGVRLRTGVPFITDYIQQYNVLACLSLIHIMALDFPLVPYPYPYDEFWEDAMLSVQNHLAANQKSYVDEEATLPPVLPPLPNNQ